ncbi:MAG: chromate transporter [Roseiflexaceae bacterium]|nr:chromate transporter [Roseiflexaceae bacterium]
MIDPLLYFWEILKASLLSTGGGNIPILHDSLIAQGWVTDRQFAEALAIGQISPGPTGLWVICLGYLVDGVRGSLLSLVGITLPPILVLVVHRVYQSIGHHPATQGFVRGLGLAVAGVFLVVLVNLMTSTGISPETIFILLGAIGLGLIRRLPVVVIIVAAALAGIALF